MASGAQRPRASERGDLVPRRSDCDVSECSTPEGIGAGRSYGSRLLPRWTARSAQRPRASERGDLRLIERMTARRGGVCSTPEGIGAGRSWRARAARLEVTCAQRPRASERGDLVGPRACTGHSRRAQRPRASERGDLGPDACERRAPSLSAQRPRASERGDPDNCSVLMSHREVLNARGHRSGEISRHVAARRSWEGVLNARGHRSGEIPARENTGHFQDLSHPFSRTKRQTPAATER